MDKLKILIPFLAVAVVAFAGYAYLTRGVVESTSLLESENTEANDVGKRLVTEITRLKLINLDGALFDNELYLGLVDFSKAVNHEPVGRPDPFAPIPGEAGADIDASSPIRL